MGKFRVRGGMKIRLLALIYSILPLLFCRFGSYRDDDLNSALSHSFLLITTIQYIAFT